MGLSCTASSVAAPGRLRWWLCWGCLLSSGSAGAQGLTPAGLERSITLPAPAIVTSPAQPQPLRQRALNLALHPTGPEAGQAAWQFTLQRYESPWRPGGAPTRDAVAVAVYLPAGARTQLGWQSRPFGAGRDAWETAAEVAAPVRPPGAMTLRSADPLADLRLGALARFSLGQQASLSLRPRKGGMRLYLQAQW